MYLIVFNGLGERLHVDRLVQLVFVQQVDEEIQRAFMDAHLRVQRADLLIDLHTTLSQSPDTHTQRGVFECVYLYKDDMREIISKIYKLYLVK